MRYGKKLALVAEAASGMNRPNVRFISHRELKSYLAQYSRYQKEDESAKKELMVQCLQQFAFLLKQDLDIIRTQIRNDGTDFSNEVAELREATYRMGVLGDSALVPLIISIGEVFSSTQSRDLHALVGDQLRTTWMSLTVEIAKLGDRYNSLSERLQSILTYADINIAGFRKLIKQYYKQVTGPNFVDLVSGIQYRNLLSDLLIVNAEFESIRLGLEQSMKALSPNPPPLKQPKLGSESLLALSAEQNHSPNLEHYVDTTLQGTSPPGIDIASLKDDYDYLRALGNSIADSLQAQTVMFRS